MKIGFAELLVIIIVAMVFIGPDKLPVYARKLGKMLNQLKEYTGEATKEVQENIVEPLEEIQKPLKEAVAPLNEIKKDLDDSVSSVTKSFTGIGKTSKTKAEKMAESEQAVDLTEQVPAEAAEQAAPAEAPEKPAAEAAEQAAPAGAAPETAQA